MNLSFAPPGRQWRQGDGRAGRGRAGGRQRRDVSQLCGIILCRLYPYKGYPCNWDSFGRDGLYPLPGQDLRATARDRPDGALGTVATAKAKTARRAVSEASWGTPAGLNGCQAGDRPGGPG